MTLDLTERAARYIAERDRGEPPPSAARNTAALDPESAHDRLTCELLPWLRGRISEKQQHFIATVQADENILRFVNSQDGERLAALGTSCPDHFLRTKIKPLYVDWDPHQRLPHDAQGSSLKQGLERYRRELRQLLRALPAPRFARPCAIPIPPSCSFPAWA